MSEQNLDSPGYHNAAHREMERKWTIIDAVAGGTLKLRDGGGQWLPMEPAEDSRDFEIRRKRAIFFNVFERTLNGLVGMVFRKDPALSNDNPPRLLDLWENIDNAGTHGAVFAKELFTTAVKYGHALIYVDMPAPLPPGATLAEERITNRRPYWIQYNPDQIVSWRVTNLDGRSMLTQIVLEEESLEAKGAYGEEEVCRYRVLRPGSWELYREVKAGYGSKEYQLEASGVTSLPYIPISPVYSRKTGFLTSRPPLLDLALINLAHYQKYSDLSTYLHIASRPILWFRGRDLNRKVEAIGPYTFFDVDSQNGHVAFAETTGAALGAAKQDIEHLEQQMATLGISILSGQKSIPTTATEELLDHLQEESDLATAARSLQDCLEMALQFTADYEGLQAGSVELGSTLADLTLTPDEMRIWLDSVDKTFSKDTIYEIFQKAGKLPADFDSEEERAKLEVDTQQLGDRLLSAFDRGQ